MKICSMPDVYHTPFDLFGPFALVTTGSIETRVYFGATFIFAFQNFIRGIESHTNRTLFTISI